MSYPSPPRRALAALTLAAALAVGTVACTSSDPVADPTTTVPTEGGTSGPNGTAAPSGTDGDVHAPDGTGGVDTDARGNDRNEVPTGDETAQDYADALVASYDPRSDDVFSMDVVECVAPIWVEAIGVGTFQSAGVTPGDLEHGGAGLDDVELDQATAETIVDALPGCGLPLFDLFVDGLGSDVTDDPATVACVRGAVSETQVRDALIGQIMGSSASDPEDLVGSCRS